MKKLDRSFFAEEMAKLGEQFSKASFSQRKGDLIYLAIRHLNEKQFSSIIDFFIGNSKFAPMVQDFQDRARAFSKDRVKEIVACTTCNGGGILSCYEKRTGINYAFSCVCSPGYDYSYLQKWGQQKQNLFTRLAPHKIFMSGDGMPYEKIPVISKGDNGSNECFKSIGNTLRAVLNQNASKL